MKEKRRTKWVTRNLNLNHNLLQAINNLVQIVSFRNITTLISSIYFCAQHTFPVCELIFFIYSPPLCFFSASEDFCLRGMRKEFHRKELDGVDDVSEDLMVLFVYERRMSSSLLPEEEAEEVMDFEVVVGIRDVLAMLLLCVLLLLFRSLFWPAPLEAFLLVTPPPTPPPPPLPAASAALPIPEYILPYLKSCEWW